MLTPSQQATLRAAILANNDISGTAPGPDSAFAIADYLAVVASPTFIVWRTEVAADEIMRNGMDWTQVDNLTVGKARIWDWLTRLGTINAAKPNVRAGIDAAWAGTAQMLAVRAAIYVHCKRSANRIEKILATGTGTDISPATMGYEGTVSYQDIMQTMGW